MSVNRLPMLKKKEKWLAVPKSARRKKRKKVGLILNLQRISSYSYLEKIHEGAASYSPWWLRHKYTEMHKEPSELFVREEVLCTKLTPFIPYVWSPFFHTITEIGALFWGSWYIIKTIKNNMRWLFVWNVPW